MSPKNHLISIIDDDQSMSRMLNRVMTALGFEVLSFESAEEFLKSHALVESACLILDVNLPGMSGVDLQRQLNDSGPRIPIVFISGQADDATKRLALEAGAAGFFSKPFKIEALLAAVRTVNTPRPTLALR
ncbi:MAG TPA: response regulator [Pyrinomonadaceae bacterium]|nr:response regulator [Pyrinomonadaceae bacterium]